jgi:MYXO-CTERM domain-containing protein
LRKFASSLVLTFGLVAGSAAFAAPDAGGGTPDARVTTNPTTPSDEDDDGCGCHVGGASSLGGGAALLGLVGLGLALVKRRR